MGIVYQKDRRSGLTYVYESTAYWDREKKQSRSRRQLIGRLDEETGQIVPTDGRGRRGAPLRPLEGTPTRQPVPGIASLASLSGKTGVTLLDGHATGSVMLFEEIGRVTGVTDELRACFPRTWRGLQSLAYYLLTRDRNAVPRFWEEAAPARPDGEEARQVEVLCRVVANITGKERQAFCSRLAARFGEDRFMACDLSSGAGIADLLRRLERDDAAGGPPGAPDCVLVTGERTGLPVYCRRADGGLADPAILEAVTGEVGRGGRARFTVVTSGRFADTESLLRLFSTGHDVLIHAPTDLPFVADFIREVSARGDFDSAYDSATRLFMFSRALKWKTGAGFVSAGDDARGRPPRMNLYFSQRKQVADSAAFRRRMDQPGATPCPGSRGAARGERERFGFFAILSNLRAGPAQVLATDHRREGIGRIFCDINDSFVLNRALARSGITEDNRLFVIFLALIHISYLSANIPVSWLTSRYTLPKVLNELDVIEHYRRESGHLPDEILRHRDFIYTSLGLSVRPS